MTMAPISTSQLYAFVTKIFSIVVFIRGGFMQTTKFTKNPDNPCYIKQGSNITLNWTYSLSPSDDPLFKAVVLELDRGGSANVRLYTATKSGGGGPGNNIGNFTGHVTDGGSLYSAKRASFKLSDVQPVHAKEELVCGLFIDADVKPVSEKLTLIVGDKPFNVSCPTGEVSYTEGEECVLRCSAAGNPQPNVTWTKEGKSEILSNETDFTITSVKKSDEGTYIFTAKNYFGDVKEKIKLKVLGAKDDGGKKEEIKTVVIIVACLGCVCLICIICILAVCCYKKKKNNARLQGSIQEDNERDLHLDNQQSSNKSA